MNYFAIAIGTGLICDGIGSMLKQPHQSFFWWQCVRLLRALAGVAVIVLFGIY
ncbi:MAG TPA: hypothetical protein VK536_07610 [Candidatus Limnocylindrales bacterium]|nr:hypothetical protein [Candidatus Limnocylindrales bacterium]